MILVRTFPQNVSTPVVTKPEQFNVTVRWDTNWHRMESVAKVCKQTLFNNLIKISNLQSEFFAAYISTKYTCYYFYSKKKLISIRAILIDHINKYKSHKGVVLDWIEMSFIFDKWFHHLLFKRIDGLFEIFSRLLLDTFLNSSDINECELPTSPCEEGCVNTEGSFNCTCRPGYYLSQDKTSCKGMVKEIGF